MDINILGIKWIQKVLELQSEIYNHEGTSQEVKDLIELRLMQIFGKEYDVSGLLSKYKGD